MHTLNLRLRLAKISYYLGVNRAVFYTLSGRGWGLVSGLLTLFFVASYLTVAEQGYFYTFAGLLGIQALFELGLCTVVLQFASHEMAGLKWSAEGTLNGDLRARTRLRSLFLLTLLWYGAIALLFIAVMVPVGLFFFTTAGGNVVSWRTEWVLIVVFTAVNVFVSPFLAAFEGLGRIVEVARMRLVQNILGSALAWFVLVTGGGLMTVPAMSAGFAVTSLVWLWTTKRRCFEDIFALAASGLRIDWRTEIWPFQWRIALSWMSGFFIFQLFTPVLFAVQGAELAGRLGMSIAIANAMLSIAIAWMNAYAPTFGALIAQKDRERLDSVYRLAFSRSFALILLIGVMLVAANYCLRTAQVEFSDRLLEPLPFLMLIMATIGVYVTHAQASYLRAHKVEPFAILSLVSASLIGGLSIPAATYFGATGLMGLYAVVIGAVGVGFGGRIFLRQRQLWDQSAP